MKKFILSLAIVICFIKASAQVNNGTFEAWHNVSILGQINTFPCPNGWNATDSLFALAGVFFGGGVQCFPGLAKELPGNGSATALKVMTVNQPAIDTLFPAGATPTFASNAKIDVDVTTFALKLIGGAPMNFVPYSVSMWVKNKVIQTDSTQIEITSIDDGDGNAVPVATADTVLWNNINTFTKITLPLTWIDSTISPTHLRIDISSNSNGSDTAFAGTYIVVDDIEINYPTGIHQYLYSSKVANIYPTQMSNQIHVNLNVNDRKKYLLYMYDGNGKKVFEKLLDQEINTIHTNQFAPGIYLYEINLDNKTMQTGKLIKE
jgi:hypothetical protein